MKITYLVDEAYAWDEIGVQLNPVNQHLKVNVRNYEQLVSVLNKKNSSH